MDERLGFELDIDVDAHKLPPAVQQLIQMDERLGRVGKALDRLERGFGGGIDKMSRGFQGLATSLTGVASALQLVERGFGAAGAVYGAFNKGANYAISAMGERSSSIRGYTQLLGGDKKQAGLEYYRAQEFAQKTDFSSETIEKSQARLLAQGFRGKDLYATLFSAADLAAIMPGNKNETLERVTMAMSQIKAKGKLQGEELTQQLAEAGLNTTLVKQQLMKSLGLKSTADVDKKMGKGEISADVALPAIQRAILQQLGTTKAGEYSTSSAGSLTSLISNRDEAAKNLLKSFDADENLPAMDRYKKALTEQGKLFDQNSRTGKQLSLVVQDMANAALDAKSAWAEFSSGFLDSFADSYTREMGRTGRNFDTEFATSALKNLGESIGHLGAIAAHAVGSTDSLVGNLAQRGANHVNAVAGFSDKLAQGDYIGAAKDFAGSYWNNALAPQAIRHNPAAQYAYNKYRAARELGEMLEGDNGLDTRYRDAYEKGWAEKIGSSRIIPTSKEETAARATAANGKPDPYRGVFWNYDFNGTSTGKWTTAPTLSDVMTGSHTSAQASTEAITSAIAGGGAQSVVININGYNRDKNELAHEIANQLSRIARRPR